MCANGTFWQIGFINDLFIYIYIYPSDDRVEHGHLQRDNLLDDCIINIVVCFCHKSWTSPCMASGTDGHTCWLSNWSTALRIRRRRQMQIPEHSGLICHLLSFVFQLYRHLMATAIVTLEEWPSFPSGVGFCLPRPGSSCSSWKPINCLRGWSTDLVLQMACCAQKRLSHTVIGVVEFGGFRNL